MPVKNIIARKRPGNRKQYRLKTQFFNQRWRNFK